MTEIKITADRAIERLEFIRDKELWAVDKLSKAAIKLSIAALREKQERDKGCEHCLLGLEIAYNAKSKHINSKESYICLDGNILEADLYTEYMAVEVRYCPMCGKRLEVEHGE